jgi:hypothetical protein
MPRLKRALTLVLIVAGILLAAESSSAIATPTSEGHAVSADALHCC